MAYWMRTQPVDNSSVATRQVLRQRAHLARKGRTDTPPTSLMGRRIVSSRHNPHCGKKQIAKNLARMGR